MRWGMLFASALACAPGIAYAQRASDNAVTAAQDAFGTTVGNETIGLYTTGNARGFSPVQAGNVRLEGLFIYQPGVAGSLTAVDTRLSRGSTVRVGIAAQSYPFVAPTGVVDFQLRLPGEQRVVSFVSTYGPYETYNGELDAQIPLVKDKLGAVVGIGGGSTMMGAGVDRMVLSGGALLHWRPSDNFELIPFYNYLMQDDWDNFAYITTAGPYTPPKIKRRAHTWQDWIQWDHRDSLTGAIGRLTMGDWVLRAGLFRSHSWRLQRGDYLLQNMTREGLADAYAIVDLPQNNHALSGEARLMRAFTEGPRRHTFQFSARGYDSHREYGGGVPTFLGKVMWGDNVQFPIPALQFTALGKDDGKQGALGINYAGAWADVGEASFSLQRTFYERTLSPPTGIQTTTRDRPWLYNGTVAAYVTRALSLYASYARGLEDAPQAPPNAANNGAAVPASLTEQYDAGFRYVITPRLRFVAGVFELTKPFLDRNAANIYTSVGTVRNRGIELSLSGQVADGLTVVAGAMFLQARVSGPAVDAGIIGPTPTATTPRQFRLNVQYTPPALRRITFEGALQHRGAQPGNRLDTFKNPANTTVDLGGRGTFVLFGQPATLRLQVLNVFNTYSFNMFAGASGLFIQGDNARRYLARFSVDVR